MILNILKYIWNFPFQFRMFWLQNLNRHRLKTYLLERKERTFPKCTECGVCCFNCVGWNSNTKVCKIWTEAVEIMDCKKFPFCPQQLKHEEVEGICRYYWGEDENISEELVKQRIKRFYEARGLKGNESKGNTS